MQLRQTGITWQVVGDDVVVLDLTGPGKVLFKLLLIPRHY